MTMQAKVYERLMPILKYWKIDYRGNLVITQEGVDAGYKEPTQAEYDEALALVEANELILVQLQRLDASLRRDAEAYHLANPTADPYLHDIATQKVALRGELV